MLQNETGTPYGATHNNTAHPDVGYLQQYMVDAIANLAKATSSDCAAIAQLTTTVERLTAELVTVNTKLVAALQTQRASRGGNRGRSRGRGAGAVTSTPNLGQSTGAVLATGNNNQDLEPPIHYCWTCGPGCRHNSVKCPTPATGHVYMATKRDMQGGVEAQK